MNTKLVSGVALAVLLAGGSGASAQDAAPAAHFAAAFQTTAGVFWYPGFTAWRGDIGGRIEYEALSGWGIEFAFGGGAPFGEFASANGGFEGRLYQAVGNIEVGFAFEGFVSAGSGISDYGLGGNFVYGGERFDYENTTLFRFSDDFGLIDVATANDFTVRPADRLEIVVKTTANLDEIGLYAFDIDTTATVAVTERLEVHGRLHADFLPYRGYYLTGGAKLDLGALAPYVVGRWTPAEDFYGLDIGVDLELPLGASAFTLIGMAEFSTTNTSGISLEAGLGLRLGLGGDLRDALDFEAL